MSLISAQCSALFIIRVVAPFTRGLHFIMVAKWNKVKFICLLAWKHFEQDVID
jgi:hypothetical protein